MHTLQIELPMSLNIAIKLSSPVNRRQFTHKCTANKDI